MPVSGVSNLGDHSRDQRQAELIQFMRKPMIDDGGYARVTHQHFIDAVGSRIALEGGVEIAVQQLAASRQRRRELAGD